MESGHLQRRLGIELMFRRAICGKIWSDDDRRAGTRSRRILFMLGREKKRFAKPRHGRETSTNRKAGEALSLE